MNIKKQLSLTVGLALGIQCIVGVIVYTSISQLLDDTKWVEHTYKVIGQANQLKRYMIDQETGMRGHVVSGIDEFLDPYRDGYVEFSALIIHLKETVSDNPKQVKRLEAVETLASQWRTNVAERYILMRQNILKGEHLEQQIRQMVESGMGKKTMDGLRAKVDQSSLSTAQKNRLILDLVNMETGLRGFLLTENVVYLEPYQSAAQLISADLQRVSASPELIAAINQWIKDYAEPLIKLAKEETATADMDALYIEFEKKEGKNYMDKIRQQLLDFIAVENQLLAQRLQKQQSTTLYAELTIIVGVFIAFVIGGLIMVRMGKSFLKTQQLQQQKLQSDTELKLLKAQVDSHFLFNTLNTIYYTANKDPELSRQLVMDLSNLMRINLKRQEELCSLADELDHVQRYLRIEKVRFQDKLTVEEIIELNTSTIQLPMFSVQTLVENAIKHGISKSLSGGTVTIHCYQQADAIVIDVCDTANMLDLSDNESKTEKSLGLNLVRDRLKQYSTFDSELQLLSEQQTTIARLMLK